MKLLKIIKEEISLPDDPTTITYIVTVHFSIGGIEASLQIPLPVDWDTMTRAQRVAWGKQQIQDHLANYVYAPPGEVIFPDTAAPEQATADFENLPNWATWTAAQAESAVHDSIFNGADLATVQAQIDGLPATIAGMKTGLKALASEIITIRSNEERMAKAIIYLRDLMIPR